MVDADLFSFVSALLIFIGGFFMKVIWNAIKELQGSDKEILERVSSIEILVAGEYVKRHEFHKTVDKVLTKLDSIDEKLDNKQDKH